MGKVAMGSMLLVGGMVLTLIPPFIWGAPVGVAGLVMICAGLFGGAKTAAKATATGIKALQERDANQAHAERVAALEAREKAVLEQELADREAALAAREAALRPRA
jgi:hypothetical protein